MLRDAASLAWVANLGCLDLNPHPVRADDLDHPDELRVDLDPVPGVPWSQVREVALVAREALEAVGLVGWPKTSGSRGIHVNVRIEPRWTFDEVRRAALALARDVERRAPALATSKWWKEERHGVFLDYNQNAKDRTVASAYSVRPTPDARVSMPLRLGRGAGRATRPTSRWPRCRALVAAARRPRARASTPRSARSRRCWSSSARHEAEGLGDAPWPPHYRKQEGEPPRVQPSKRRAPCGRRRGRRRPRAPSPTGRRRSTKPLIEIARAARKEDALAGPGALEGHVTPRPRRTSSRRTSSSMPCAAAPRRGRASASTSSMSRRRCAHPRRRSIPTTTRGQQWSTGGRD